MHGTKKISILERLSLISVYARLPFSILLSVVLSPFSQRFKKKRVGRVALESFFRFFLDHTSERVVQYDLGTSIDAYKTLMKSKRRTPLIEDVGGNAKLMWITEKRTDRVLYYVHGGAFVMPVNAVMLGFVARVQEELLKLGNTNDFGVVAVTYSLHPEKFPTQLTEVTLGLTHIISSGVKQENIVLIGDSAGGNLIAQLLAHTLHPVEGVPPSPLRRASEYPKLLGGACLLSPWVSLDTPTPSYKKNNDFDVVSSAWLLKCGGLYTDGVPKHHIPYIRPNTCGPEERWFADLDQYVSRVLITGGDKEILFDDATGLYDGMKPNDDEESMFSVQLLVDEDGIHEDPIFESMIPKKSGGISETTVKVINWVGECFKQD